MQLVRYGRGGPDAYPRGMPMSPWSESRIGDWSGGYAATLGAGAGGRCIRFRSTGQVLRYLRWGGGLQRAKGEDWLELVKRCPYA